MAWVVKRGRRRPQAARALRPFQGWPDWPAAGHRRVGHGGAFGGTFGGAFGGP
jgi:hypothetical protein